MASVEDQLGIKDDERLEAQAKAAGVCCAHFVLSDEDMKFFDRTPVLVYGRRGLCFPMHYRQYCRLSSSHAP